MELLKKLIFQEGTFRAQKIFKKRSKKNFLYFRKWNFLAPSLKNFYIFYKKKISFIFRKQLAKLGKQKFLIFL